MMSFISLVATEFEKFCDCKMNHNCDYVYRMNRLLDAKSFYVYKFCSELSRKGLNYFIMKLSYFDIPKQKLYIYKEDALKTRLRITGKVGV